jgi:hypothetical protein
MSDRAIRRAAERAAKKAAAKAAKANEAAKTMTASANTPNWESWDGWDNDDPPPPPPCENGDQSQKQNTRPISDAKLAANRQNAQHSTGAKTQAGKDKSKMNSLRNALTGQTVLLPTDDAVAYQALVAIQLTQVAAISRFTFDGRLSEDDRGVRGEVFL